MPSNNALYKTLLEILQHEHLSVMLIIPTITSIIVCDGVGSTCPTVVNHTLTLKQPEVSIINLSAPVVYSKTKTTKRSPTCQLINTQPGRCTSCRKHKDLQIISPISKYAPLANTSHDRVAESVKVMRKTINQQSETIKELQQKAAASIEERSVPIQESLADAVGKIMDANKAEMSEFMKLMWTEQVIKVLLGPKTFPKDL